VNDSIAAKQSLWPHTARTPLCGGVDVHRPVSAILWLTGLAWFSLDFRNGRTVMFDLYE
jgi:hypothetical protein